MMNMSAYHALCAEQEDAMMGRRPIDPRRAARWMGLLAERGKPGALRKCRMLGRRWARRLNRKIAAGTL